MRATGTDRGRDGTRLAPLLTGRQRQAIFALLNGATKTEAAAAAGVHRNSVTAWLRQPQFQAEYLRLCGLVERDAIQTLRVGRREAARYCLQVLRHGGGQTDRLAAARMVLSAAGQLDLGKLFFQMGAENALRQVQEAVGAGWSDLQHRLGLSEPLLQQATAGLEDLVDLRTPNPEEVNDASE